MAKNKHLTAYERSMIEKHLDNRGSFRSIARLISHDASTISKEVRNHICYEKTMHSAFSYNDCLHRLNCKRVNICDNPHKCDENKRPYYCRNCAACISSCPDYEQGHCHLLSKPPYVCNGCKNLKRCTLEKTMYRADYAQSEYEQILHESRSGVALQEEELQRLNDFLTPLIQKGQSIHHICIRNKDTIMHCEKTLYNYVQYNLFTARNIDLPRKVRFRPRKSVKEVKIDKKCHIGRTYEDFLIYMKENPDTPIVEIDSVIGTKGGKCLLTIHFVDSELMIAFLRDANTSQSVIDVFEHLYRELRPDFFQDLFPVILTDNGSEFSNPSAIEFDAEGNRRTRIFYCDPSAPYQKGSCENNHTLIRRILPKGNSFNKLTQAHVDLIMDHINSYTRKKLNDKSPFESFSFLHGSDLLNQIGVQYIAPKDVNLSPSLLK